MKITKQHLNSLIQELEEKIDVLFTTSWKQAELIKTLQKRNSELESNNNKTLEQIKDHVKELEQIRNYYVSSNNNSQ